jgi:hypothetical protein
MPMKPNRMCSQCLATALPGTNRCALHPITDRRVRGSEQALRHTARWLRCRKRIVWRDVQCQCGAEPSAERLAELGSELSSAPVSCGMNHGGRCLQLAVDVHHIVDAADLPIDTENGDTEAYFWEGNLVGLCHDCHSRITRSQQ